MDLEGIAHPFQQPNQRTLSEQSPSSFTPSPATFGKRNKTVTGRHNDTELHVAAQRGDLTSVKQILGDMPIAGTFSSGGAEFDEIRAAAVNEVNKLGETALFTAAMKGHVEVVKELLKYSNTETVSKKNRSGFDPFHISALEGHHAVVQVFLDHDPSLSKRIGQSHTTPLVSAASRGHSAVVNELLSRDCNMLEICGSDGKNALHLAARHGNVGIVKSLLEKDPQLARRCDKKGQTSLHMAVKGKSCEVVKLLLEAEAALVMIPDKNSNTALHVATRKKRAKIVDLLLSLRDTNVNALTREHKTALDIAEELRPSEESSYIKMCLSRYGAFKTVSEIKEDVHTQLEQTMKTSKNVNVIAEELRQIHREGINNATNSVTVVAVLFATVAFAAIFTVPGGDDDYGKALIVDSASFKVFLISDAIALFTSLAVVVVQITLVRGETKAERRVIEVINKLMWLASVCTSVAFIASSYIVVGRKCMWAAIVVTVVGGVIMTGVLGTMTYCVIKSKRVRSMRKKDKLARSGFNSSQHSDLSDSDIDRIYAL